MNIKHSLKKFNARLASTAVFVLLLLSGHEAARAIQVQVAGHITSYEFGLNDITYLNQPYLLTFDWIGPGTAIPTGMTGAIYPDAGQSFTLQLGDYLITSTKAGYVLAPNTFSFGSAAYWGTTVPGSSISATLVGDLFPYYAVIESQVTAPGSPALLAPILNSTDYSYSKLVLRFATSLTPDAAFGVKSIYGAVDSITAVPEPETQTLFIFGAFGILIYLYACKSRIAARGAA